MTRAAISDLQILIGSLRSTNAEGVAMKYPYATGLGFNSTKSGVRVSTHSIASFAFHARRSANALMRSSVSTYQSHSTRLDDSGSAAPFQRRASELTTHNTEGLAIPQGPANERLLKCGTHRKPKRDAPNTRIRRQIRETRTTFQEGRLSCTLNSRRRRKAAGSTLNIDPATIPTAARTRRPWTYAASPSQTSRS